MKYLLQKSLRRLSVFTFIVFALSIPSYYFLVDWIWLKELDENNDLIAQRVEIEFNKQIPNDEQLTESIKLWNSLQPQSKIEAALLPLEPGSRYTISRTNPYFNTLRHGPTDGPKTIAPEAITGQDFEKTERYRGLKTPIKINGKHYTLIVETNVEETKETVAYIAMITLLFFLILVIGFWILNRHVSKKLWLPFQDSLQKLKAFRLNGQQRIEFLKTDTIEFAELNETLDRLLQHSKSTYNSQREFTENASHELQTPLAVLKNKLDILLQSEDLTEKQYHIVEEMNKALLRSSRINRNLLLLAKIENSQFDTTEPIAINTLVGETMEEVQEHFNEKNINVSSEIEPNVEVLGNRGLTEVLINNLIFNAIRHTLPGGAIRVISTKTGFEVRNSGEQTLDTDLLFKRFSKISSDGSDSGSGLGLGIVRQIAKYQHWQVSYLFEYQQHVFSVKF